MKAMVAARTEPYLAGWNRLRTDPHAELNYTPKPSASMYRIPSMSTYVNLHKDGIAANLHAVQWVVTGDAAHARKTAEILNAWSSTMTGIPSTGDPILAAGITGYLLAAAGEVLRATYPEWSVADQTRLKNLLVNVFYPPLHNFLIYHEPDGRPHTNTGVNQHFFTNWDAVAMNTIAAMGVFADDRAVFEDAVNAFKNGIAIRKDQSLAVSSSGRPRLTFSGSIPQWMVSGAGPEPAPIRNLQGKVLRPVAVSRALR